MARTGTFLCTKAGPKPKIFDLAGFNAVVAAYGEGEDFQLSIEEVGRKRTQAQNRFFHGPILKAFMTLGHGHQEAKDMLCLLFIPQDVHMLDGSIVRVPGHTAALTVEAFNDLIDNCLRLAAEQELEIEDVEVWKRQRRAA